MIKTEQIRYFQTIFEFEQFMADIYVIYLLIPIVAYTKWMHWNWICNSHFWFKKNNES